MFEDVEISVEVLIPSSESKAVRSISFTLYL